MSAVSITLWGRTYGPLPERFELKVNQRAGTAWLRRAGVVLVITPDGPLTVDADDHRALLEGWDLLP